MISIFQADAAFALELIALTTAAGLIFWMRLYPKTASKFCYIFAYSIAVLAFLTLLCTGYYATQYWLNGHFDQPHQSTLLKQTTLRHWR